MAVSPPLRFPGPISISVIETFRRNKITSSSLTPPSEKPYSDTPLIHIQLHSNPNPRFFRPRNRTNFRVIQCTSSTSGKSSGERETPVWWKEWIQKREKAGFGFGPDKVLRSIAGATSGPICQFIPAPVTFLHSVDPRIKLAMIVRGFRGDSKTHKIHFPCWSFAVPDFISILALCGLIGASRLSACFLV